MNEKPLLTIVMPAFNEAENLVEILPPLLEFCRQRNWKIILVNDGSLDKTKEILLPFQGSDSFVAINHKLNKGYGAAIKTGIQACDTTYVITIDADGQHSIADIEKLFICIQHKDADMVVGSRRGSKSETVSRGIGKSIIRTIAQMLMQVPIYDINSGMKIYRTALARKYLHLAPDTMAFSDIISLIFINNRHLVLEEPITISSRLKGKSTIGMQTAFQTVMEIVNILVLFNPMKIFLPISALTLIITLIWGVPLVIAGRGISTGTLLGIISTLIFFFLGLITEQLSQIRRNQKQGSGD
ncbi:MAG TPA: glycosyltransferase family 2 protein [Saprospiraceae bacterium]|nr:glycosyltransferase family 2 protein [Saprospiraceae bacterium]